MVRRRERWQKHQDKFDPKRLVFIDETWVKTNMTRTHGRCALGERLVAKVPHGHWKTLTFVGAPRCDGITAPCVLDGPINAVSFLAYVTQFLVPTLRPGDVVIIDNLGSIAKGGSSVDRTSLENHRHTAGQIYRSGMCQLPSKLRICVNLKL